MRADSPGHSAKYGSYTLMHMDSNSIVDLQLVQSNEIQKYLSKRSITQYYDLWHFEKGLSKKLEKLVQNKDCGVLKKWLCSIKNHVYWSATSSTSGPEKVAKWTSIVNHIQNVHLHENPLFPKCQHPD
ncbi:hypothetical protein UPYG_G00114980 [Umbra pygmaea]|uniref:Uncharacterized protein n=1 Tax=Umbra pygmaea TaxID=75934 RepID=A0ABD0X7N0_UMBPY